MTGQPAIVFHRLPGLNPAREPNSNVASQGAAQIAQLPAHIVILSHFSGSKIQRTQLFLPSLFGLGGVSGAPPKLHFQLRPNHCVWENHFLSASAFTTQKNNGEAKSDLDLAFTSISHL